jgi:maltooligosyltrehalose trehalohydrolase
MLFQGQEFGASSRFLFFADHKPELAEKIREGRIQFLGQWRSLVLPEMKHCFDDPASPHSFEQSRLDFSEVKKHAAIYALHRDLLRLRREDPVISLQGEEGIDGAVLSSQCFVLRFFSENHQEDRLLLVNLGIDLDLNPAPEPLLAPPYSSQWMKLWSSDDPQYGGCGTAVLDSKENWRIPGQAAVVLQPIVIQS